MLIEGKLVAIKIIQCRKYETTLSTRMISTTRSCRYCYLLFVIRTIMFAKAARSNPPIELFAFDKGNIAFIDNSTVP